jgi:hypothetical protein
LGNAAPRGNFISWRIYRTNPFAAMIRIIDEECNAGYYFSKWRLGASIFAAIRLNPIAAKNGPELIG